MKRMCMAALIGMFLASGLLAGEVKEPKKDEPALAGKKILMVIAAKDFRDEELAEPKKLFETQGAAVTVASTTVQECTGMNGAKVKPDTTIDKAKAKDYDAVVFVGGSGAEALFDNKQAHKLAKEAVKEKRVLAAICLAPVILADAGVLKDKEATVWDDEDKTFSQRLTIADAKYKKEDVVADGRIVTANGPDASRAFARQIIATLQIPPENDTKSDDEAAPKKKPHGAPADGEGGPKLKRTDGKGGSVTIG